MPDPIPNDPETSVNSSHPRANDAARLAGEPLEGSGFEEEIPETDFEWRD